ALASRGGWQIHQRSDKASGSSAPSVPATERIAKIGADGMGISAAHEAPACSENIGKRVRADFEFQYSSVVTFGRIVGFQIVTVGESDLRGARRKNEAWRNQFVQADIRDARRKSRIGRSLIRGCLCDPV